MPHLKHVQEIRWIKRFIKIIKIFSNLKRHPNSLLYGITWRDKEDVWKIKNNLLLMVWKYFVYELCKKCECINVPWLQSLVVFSSIAALNGKFGELLSPNGLALSELDSEMLNFLGELLTAWMKLQSCYSGAQLTAQSRDRLLQMFTKMWWF